MDFGVGEPDFATPAFVAAAGAAAISAGRTKYTDVAGEPALRDAIAAKYRAEQGADFARENVVVTAGAKQAVFNACQVLFGPGDEVVLFSPYWVSFPEMVRLAGAEPLFVETELESNWHARVERLARAAGPKTRGVILNSPEQSDRRGVDARGDRGVARLVRRARRLADFRRDLRPLPL